MLRVCRVFLITAICFVLASLANAFETSADYAIIIDANTSEVLYQKNANEKMHPSSLTKLLTSYVVFEKLEANQFSIDTKTRVSEKAWKQRGSSMFLKHRERVSINQLLNGLITQSGNDAALVLAETAGKNELSFVDEMNKTAQELGLQNSHFKNPTGLNQDGHHMTVRDIALLSQRLIQDYPQYYNQFFNNRYYSHNNIKQKNRNLLIGNYEGVDGLKTGHTSAGGYGIAVSAVRDGRRLIAVLNGMQSKLERKNEAIKALDYGFDNFDRVALFKKGETIVRVNTWLSSQDKVQVNIKDDLTITYKKGENPSSNEIKIYAEYYEPLTNDTKTNDKVGTLYVEVNNQKFSSDLVLGEAINKAKYSSRVLMATKHRIKSIFRILTN